MLSIARKEPSPDVLPLSDIEVRKVKSLEEAMPIIWHSARPDGIRQPESDGERLLQIKEHRLANDDRDIELVVRTRSTLLTDAVHVHIGERDGQRHITLKDAGFCIVMDPTTARVTDRYLTPRCAKELTRLSADNFDGVVSFVSLGEGAKLPPRPGFAPEEPQSRKKTA